MNTQNTTPGLVVPDFDLTVRLAQHPDDLEHMQEMLGYAAGYNDSDPHLPDYYAALKQGLFDGIVGEVDGQPIGAAWFSYFNDAMPGYAQYGGYPEVTIGIEQGYRSKGVGRVLMNRLVSLAREKKVGGLVLDVNTANRYAVRLYNSIGFVPCKPVFGNYQTMCLSLAQVT